MNVLETAIYLLTFLFLLLLTAGLTYTEAHGACREYLFAAITGGMASLTYCMRAVYLNFCVHERWDIKWTPWYVLRPFVGCIIGVIILGTLKMPFPEVRASHLFFLIVAASLNSKGFFKRIFLLKE